MAAGRRPPKAHQSFIKRYPKLGEAWDCMRAAEAAGPLKAKTARLIKLGIAVGALREGAVHSAARKVAQAGASRAEIEQVIALAASTIGLPATVATFTWVRESMKK